VANQQVTIYIDPELRRAYRMVAADTGHTFSELIAAAMSDHLSRSHPKIRVAHQGIGDPSPQPGVATPDASVAMALGEMTTAIDELRRKIAQNSPEVAPDALQLRYAPQVEDAARKIVSFLETIGAEGIQGTPFQTRMVAMGPTKQDIKTATAALRRMDVIDRLRRGWVLSKYRQDPIPRRRKGK
jgi:hypothetical protein